MAKYKIILWEHSTNKDGMHPIKLRINIGSQKKYIGLDVYAIPSQWINSTGRMHTKATKKELGDETIVVHKDSVTINDYISKQELKAKNVIEDFDNRKIDWTLSQFEAEFLHKAIKGNVNEFFLKIIKEQKETNRVGNAISYERTLLLLHIFDKNFDKKVFTEIDIKFVREFDTFLQMPRVAEITLKSGKVKKIKRNGCCGNTRKFYFKALRSIYNKAIELKQADLLTYPFGEGGFKVAALDEETEKRYLPNKFLLKLKSECSIDPMSEYARKLFLFSYYTYGMSFSDMAYLTKKNIKTYESGLYIEYKRAKTMRSRKPISIKIKLTEELQTIIQELCATMQPMDNYLLPIITKSGYEGEQLYLHCKTRLKKYTKYLKALAIEFEFGDINLTSYVSRHTMAMTLQGQDVPREVISQILGHKDLNTTATYLDSFNSNVIDEAAKLL